MRDAGSTRPSAPTPIGPVAATGAGVAGGGVPGRNEIGTKQELHYPAICAAIAGTGYAGYIGQEFIPALDPMESLQSAITLCRDPRIG